MNRNKGPARRSVLSIFLLALCAAMVAPLFLFGPCDLQNRAAIAAAYNFYATTSVSSGDVVVWDSGLDYAVKTTTQEGEQTVAGVAAETAPAGAECTIRQDGGRVAVNIVGSVTKGQWLITSAPAGKARGVSSLRSGIFGRAITDGGVPASGQVYASINLGFLGYGQSGGGVSDHGALTGLGDDDHSQYHNNARGNARYLYRENSDAFTPDADYEPATKKYVDDTAGASDHGGLSGLNDPDHNASYFQESEFLNSSAGAGDAGKPIKLDADGDLPASMINSPDVDHDQTTNFASNEHFTKASISHTEIQDIGSKSHATLDSEVADNTTHAGQTDDPHSVTKDQVGLANVEDLKVKLDGTVAPDADNDTTEGYSVGSRWIDEVAGKEYVCLDATEDAAEWTETTGAGGGGGAPTDAEYWTGAADGGLSNEHNLAALNAGLVYNTGGTPSQATPGTDYMDPADFTAKGDMLIATGDGAYAKLAVGSNGQRLEADSGEATGAKWVTPDAASGDGNEYIPFEMRFGIPTANLGVIDFRQGLDTTNWHPYAARLGLSGTSTASNLYLGIQLPSDFDSFYSGTNVWIQVFCNDRANGFIKLYIGDDTGDPDDGVNGADIEPGSDSTWAEATDQLTESYSAGDWITLRVEVELDADDYYLIGEGHLRYVKS